MSRQHGCRAKALQDLALLAARSPKPSDSLFEDLYARCNRFEQNRESEHSPIALKHEEIDTILALCHAAPWVNSYAKASQLQLHLSPYLIKAHSLAFEQSPFLRRIQPSLWESLTYHLTRAVLQLGLKYNQLHQSVTETISEYVQTSHELLQAFASTKSPSIGPDLQQEDSARVLVLTLSLLGFLEAVAGYANFFGAEEMIEVVEGTRAMLHERHLALIESIFSDVRATEYSDAIADEWDMYSGRYAAAQRPLGGLLLQQCFLRLLLSASSLQIASVEQLSTGDTLNILLAQDESVSRSHYRSSSDLTKLISKYSVDALQTIEHSSDSPTMTSAWQQGLAFSVKAHCLHVYLNCMIADSQSTDQDLLIAWLQNAMADSICMAEENLASVVLKCLAILARHSSKIASDLSNSLPRFIVQSGIKGNTVDVAARSLTYVLRLMSQDAVITGIYTLGNVLSAGSGSERATRGYDLPNGIHSLSKSLTLPSQAAMQHSTGSVISLNVSGDEAITAAYGKIVRAIVCVAINVQDETIAALALSMLLQKLGRVSIAVDLHIIREAAHLAQVGGTNELKSLLRLYDRIGHEGVRNKNGTLLGAVRSARIQIAKDLSHDSPFYPLCLISLLETVISKGDVHDGKLTHHEDVKLAAQEIEELIPPLAALVSVRTDKAEISDDENIARLHREAWFNVAIHGITPSSAHGKQYKDDLRTLASKSIALIAEPRGDQFESEIELNTVLRRGMNGPNTAEQKKSLIDLLPRCEADIRSLSYPKVVFLNSMFLVETLRAEAGNCSHILTYFLDPSLNGSAMEHCASAVAAEVIAIYLKRVSGGQDMCCEASLIADQLVSLFVGCCHRIPRVQQVAASSADQIVGQLPSALCQKSSLFALLELLTFMWTSCLEIELDEYELKSNYSSERGKVSVELSDDYGHRRATLNNLYKRAKSWVAHVIDIAPLNIKGLLQTYLSEYADDGTYGHMALGRSFAVDMGSYISAADHKLAVTDRHGDCNINTASDFVAQYTSRQEYKYADDLPNSTQSWDEPVQMNGVPKEDLQRGPEEQRERSTILEPLETRAREGDSIAVEELRDGLQRAAATFCKAKDERPSLLQQLVDIPFYIFTKQSIRLGISLWLNIMNEKPATEPRLLALIAEGWEKSMYSGVGAFSPYLHHPDPFFLKEEFAPSEKALNNNKQQIAHDLIAPHLKLLQFFTSHYNANRIGNSQAQQVFLRLVRLTLDQLKVCAGHPLAREFYFQVVLLGLTILRHSVGLSPETRWHFKDAILSAGLAWFRFPPRWSFGGNRLQIKADIRLMTDVDTALHGVSAQFSQPTQSLTSLSLKQELLSILVENEQTRLLVWLFPLDHEKRRLLPVRGAHKGPSDAVFSQLLQVAWAEDPRLAVHLTNRFPSAAIHDQIRTLVLRHPEKVIDEPDALHLLIGASLPTDISRQLRYLLYWAPVNPVTAITYFLPEFNNDPYIIQYAMRALESHSVDVTFFYVPQIVQTLRYDVLGYVQRYILETAQVSQLFAHQIIWNMTANAYKDEDSSIEDTLKPTLDIIKDRMIKSFSGDDEAFYEREFAFFDEITNISGKLRPFIKKSKPEKKQKIEEELRKIKVDVGVYLPSNPDGTVIGIDRKSGKPLQSHAKAPYMATFRIRKTQGGVQGLEDMIKHDDSANSKPMPRANNFYEVWQSAIFKVGDDCRQDILALQMIAAFRGIFNNVGLDVYVYPYRVTATAPGCGVIDVLPNSISRDMLGREAINGLYEYFVSKYGAETCIAFQEARNNFVKSMAAYSVISYLLQFKDRHNGNIMVDDAGHILHIDFGFCFDIAPGGVRFERAPFKLTSEMVAVMGGNISSQPFKWFEELCIKAFLAARPHAEKLCHIVVLMLGSGLPCFKPETIKHLRERFVLDKTEREAADFMRDLIKKSYGSYSTKGYDQFQLLTNGIPY